MQIQQSTDTGDYFPEGYNKEEEVAFTEGMGGSQSAGSGDRGPALPGMENLGDDAVMMGGIEMAEGIPAGVQVTVNSVGSPPLLSILPTASSFLSEKLECESLVKAAK